MTLVWGVPSWKVSEGVFELKFDRPISRWLERRPARGLWDAIQQLETHSGRPSDRQIERLRQESEPAGGWMSAKQGSQVADFHRPGRGVRAIVVWKEEKWRLHLIDAGGHSSFFEGQGRAALICQMEKGGESILPCGLEDRWTIAFGLANPRLSMAQSGALSQTELLAASRRGKKTERSFFCKDPLFHALDQAPRSIEEEQWRRAMKLKSPSGLVNGGCQGLDGRVPAKTTMLAICRPFNPYL